MQASKAEAALMWTELKSVPWCQSLCQLGKIVNLCSLLHVCCISYSCAHALPHQKIGGDSGCAS